MPRLRPHSNYCLSLYLNISEKGFWGPGKVLETCNQESGNPEVLQKSTKWKIFLLTLQAWFV